MKIRTRLAPSPTGDPHVGQLIQPYLTMFLQKNMAENIFFVQKIPDKKDVPKKAKIKYLKHQTGWVFIMYTSIRQIKHI